MSSAQKNITVALLAFIDDDGKVLLNRRRDATSEAWEFIGGGVEEGEQPIDAIQREIFEEVNYTLLPEDDLKFVKDFLFENERYVAKVSFFTAKFPGLHDFSDSDETHVADLKLFDPAEALELPLLPITHDILQNIMLTAVVS